ncbi:MAG: site-2 protease family protein [Myxococcota bacterium]
MRDENEEAAPAGEPPSPAEWERDKRAEEELASPVDRGGTAPQRPPRFPALRHLLRGWRLNLLLFVATLFTTYFVGGAAYCATLVAILICHEMGHYLTARRYGVRASLPYFIPVPFALGTFGAVIKMDASIPHRRALVAIGAAGPLAGLAVAVPLLFYGLSLSEVHPNAGPMPGLTDFGLMATLGDLLLPAAGEPKAAFFFLEGDSLLYLLAKHLVFDLPEGHDVWIHPVAFAAWIGLFITALNMLPVGQLDGGHVAHGLWGKKADGLNNAVRGILLGLGLTVWVGWLLWVVLITFILRASGGEHPPVQDPERPLGAGMKAVGFAALLTLALTFSPTPLREIRLDREQALAIPAALKESAGICDEWIEWRFDAMDKSFRERLADPPPECP